MDIGLFSQVAAIAPAGFGAGLAKTPTMGPARNFADFLEKSLGRALTDARDILGRKVSLRTDLASGSFCLAGGRQAATPRTVPEGEPAGTWRPSLDGGKVEGQQAIMLLLAQFFQGLQAVAEEAKPGPGDWVVELPDDGWLEQLTVDLGLSEAERALLAEQVKSRGGKLSLTGLFGVLDHHFTDLGGQRPVTIPETDLPLLETLVTRAGGTPEWIRGLEERSVLGDGRVDFAAFLEGLGRIGKSAAAGITLSPWEREELARIIGRAADSVGQQATVPVEKAAEGTAVWRLEDIRGLLQQGLAAIEGKRAAPAAGIVVADLMSLVIQAGFEERTVGWAPLIQKTINDMRENLLKTVDLATVKVEKGPVPVLTAGKGGDDATLAAAKPAMPTTGEDGDAWASLPAGAEELATGFSDGEGESKDSGIKAVAPDPFEAEALGPAAEEGQAVAAPADDERPLREAAFRREDAGPQPSAFERLLRPETADAGAVRQPVVRPAPLPPAPQIVEQMASGVLRGLENQEHRLVLKLSPPELGEVKVDLTVKDDHIRVVFSMESTRVKASIESGMAHFRDTLEQQGFVLDELSVSVGQHDRPGEERPRFVIDWDNWGKRAKIEAAADPGQGGAYLAGHNGRRDHVINLLV